MFFMYQHFTKYPAEEQQQEQQQSSNFKDREFKSRGQKVKMISQVRNGCCRIKINILH